MRINPLIALAAAAALSFAGCAGVSEATKEAAQKAASAAATVSVSQTVDFNSASEDEIKVALEANGVANAEKMADEVKEYAPYTKENIASKLADELGKYKVSPEDLAKIIATFEMK